MSEKLWLEITERKSLGDVLQIVQWPISGVELRMTALDNKELSIELTPARIDLLIGKLTELQAALKEQSNG